MSESTENRISVSSVVEERKPRTRLFPSRLGFPRLVSRKERWGLSWLGWITVVAIVLLFASAVVLCVYPFLATTHRVDANVLVIEGWVHPYAIRAGVDEFKAGGYQRIFTTGGPVNGIGGYINDANTSASVGASGVEAAGVPNEFIQMVPSQVNDRDRTYSSAVALRRWLSEHHAEVKGVNVVTENTHARRTWLLFQKAFGNKVRVGVIGARNPDYDSKEWWSCSEGVRDVLDEGIAYVYAKFFFYPSQSSDRDEIAGTSQTTANNGR
jgi:uncharacterized SAM-binding protein YcdF (DUF218 family)